MGWFRATGNGFRQYVTTEPSTNRQILESSQINGRATAYHWILNRASQSA
jgi:hypothetical protein